MVPRLGVFVFALLQAQIITGFVRSPTFCHRRQQLQERQEEVSQSPRRPQQVLLAEKNDNGGLSLTRVPEAEENVPIPFLDRAGSSFIECYADSFVTIDGTEYTIGIPCDYCVALCYVENENLIPVELDDKLMDDVFPVAENIVAEEFGEDLVLQRTPQTLTLVGELEDDDEDDDDDDAGEEDGEDEAYSGEEEVELLLSFEHREKEFSLVRLLDPVLLVGKTDPEGDHIRALLTAEESSKVMPMLEEMFLKYHAEREATAP